MAIGGHSSSNFSRTVAANPLILRTINWNARKAFRLFPRGASDLRQGSLRKGGESRRESQELGYCRKGLERQLATLNWMDKRTK
jgi:hypothetical protein